MQWCNNNADNGGRDNVAISKSVLNKCQKASDRSADSFVTVTKLLYTENLWLLSYPIVVRDVPMNETIIFNSNEARLA